jgi:HEAT repeat protein
MQAGRFPFVHIRNFVDFFWESGKLIGRHRHSIFQPVLTAMKRFFSAVVLCASLLVVMSFWLFPHTAAKEDPIVTLLNLPAPPPPNPWVRALAGSRPPEFYNKSTPPPDNAPIEDLMEYWSRQSSGYQELGYNPKPSGQVMDRLLREIEKDPTKIGGFLNVLTGDRRAADLVKGAYSRASAGTDEEERESRAQLRRWLTYNTPEFSADLEKTARTVKDVGEYVSNQDELLALSRVDWDRASPIVNGLYNDRGQKVSQVLATWALYRNALDSGSVGDTDRYREELKAVVENKDATDAMRDLALDALIKEKEWGGREDWYVSLMADETLHELKVNGTVYTGLTTIMYYEPDERYIDRMIGLAASDNIWVRTAAAKNLLTRLGRLGETESPNKIRLEIVRALLTWLENPKWINDDGSRRLEIIRALQSVKMPESVPALIAALDEQETVNTRNYAAIANAANAIANAANVVVSAANYSANRPAVNALPLGPPRTFYPLRSNAITALAMQADMRATPALRRVLPQVEEYERTSAVKALLACNGFTTDEQVEALEFLARNAGDIEADLSANTNGRAGSGSMAAERAKMAMRAAIAGQRTTVAPVAEETDEAADEFEDYAGPASDTPANAIYTGGGHDHVEYAGPSSKPLDANELRYLVGSQLVGIEDVSDDLVRAMVDRIAIHDKKDPVLADSLRKVMLGWKGTALNALLLRDLKSGRLDADAIVKLLSVRKELREKQQPDVTDIRTGSQQAIGIAACLMEDKADFDSVLENGSDAAKTTAFACARLIRAPLPVQKVAPSLKSSNKLLAMAAERYLESEDSPEARAIVLSLYPNQAKILGATTSFEVKGLSAMPGTFLRDVFASVHNYYAAETYAYTTFGYNADFAEVEKRLQKEVTTNADLIGAYAYDKTYVRIYKDKAVFSWEDDPARYRERVLEQPEFENLKGYLAHFKVDQLPPFLACTGECEAKELLMLGRQGGRRVFVKSDTGSTPEFFSGLAAIFSDMKQRPAKLKYWAGDQVPGLEILFADEHLAAKSVWKSGVDLRVLVTETSKEKAIEQEIDRLSDEADEGIEDETDPDSRYMKFYKMRQSRQFESYSWFNLGGDRLGAAVPQPAQTEYIPLKDAFVPASSFGQWKAKVGTVEIRADETGLFKITGGRVAKIKTGNYSDPVVTANGRWLVVTKYDDEAGPMLMRINLLTNREIKVESGEFPVSKALCYVASRNLVMVTSYDEGEGHDEYEESYNEAAYDNGLGYYMLNPDTGMVYPAAGEVRPLAQQTFRGLQPAAAAGDFWAAMPRGKAGTIVGVYSTRTFEFKPILKLPKTIFDSTQMWVDAVAGKVYFVYEGHLLSAPLSLPPKK